MSTPSTSKTTSAFYVQAGVSFAVAVGALIVGIAYLQGIPFSEIFMIGIFASLFALHALGMEPADRVSIRRIGAPAVELAAGVDADDVSDCVGAGVHELPLPRLAALEEAVAFLLGVGAYMLWVVVLAIMLLRTTRGASDPLHRSPRHEILS